MQRTDETTDLIDLGAASVETKGPAGLIGDQNGKNPDGLVD